MTGWSKLTVSMKETVRLLQAQDHSLEAYVTFRTLKDNTPLSVNGNLTENLGSSGKTSDLYS